MTANCVDQRVVSLAPCLQPTWMAWIVLCFLVFTGEAGASAQKPQDDKSAPVRQTLAKRLAKRDSDLTSYFFPFSKRTTHDGKLKSSMTGHLAGDEDGLIGQATDLKDLASQLSTKNLFVRAIELRHSRSSSLAEAPMMAIMSKSDTSVTGPMLALPMRNNRVLAAFPLGRSTVLDGDDFCRSWTGQALVFAQSEAALNRTHSVTLGDAPTPKKPKKRRSTRRRVVGLLVVIVVVTLVVRKRRNPRTAKTHE